MATTPLSFRLRISGRMLDASFQVPASPVPADALLPVFQQFTNQVVEDAVAAGGQPISCCAGCGACCRQMVPISESEARMLLALVEAMPEPQRAEVQRRFESAAEQLSEFRSPSARTGSLREFGLAYFAKKVACPFLVDESCSIHPSRPLACREYLVTSPAANCAEPSPERIRMVHLSARPSHALVKIEADKPVWMPLVFALEWATANRGTELIINKTGPEWMKALVDNL